MSIAKCPHCQDEVRVPSVHIESIVQCPLCKEEYSLKEVMKSLPPALIVVEQAGVSGDAIIGSSVVVPREGEAAEAAEPAAPFKFEDTSQPSDDDKPRPAAPPAVVTSSRRRKEKSAAGELLKVIFGGVVGVAIAQLILWWLPGKWSKDPFDFGPKAAKYVPWIVPERWSRADGESNDSSNNDNTRSGFTLEDLRRKLREHEAQNGKDEPQTPGGGGAFSAGANAKKGKASRDDQKSSKADSKDSGNSSTDDLSSNLGFRKAPKYSADAVTNAWRVARSANNEWTNDDLHDQRLFEAMANLAERMTFIDMKDPGIGAPTENTRRLLKEISQSPKRLTAITNRAPAWLNEIQRGTEGIFLYGRIESIKKDDLYYETRLDVYSEPKRQLTVVSVVDPAKGNLKKGQSVIILGTIVESPQKKLVGFSGSQSFVVFGGYPLIAQPPPAKIQVDSKKGSKGKKKGQPSKKDDSAKGKSQSVSVTTKKVPITSAKRIGKKSGQSSKTKEPTLYLLQLPLDGNAPGPQPIEKK